MPVRFRHRLARGDIPEHVEIWHHEHLLAKIFAMPRDQSGIGIVGRIDLIRRANELVSERLVVEMRFDLLSEILAAKEADEPDA